MSRAKNPNLRFQEKKPLVSLSSFKNMKKDTPGERIVNGIYFENPVFMLLLGMCPTLATTTSVTNAIGMGLSTTAILTLSNIIISLLRNIIPERMRMPSYIVVIASFVTIVDFLMAGFTPGMYQSLGVYIPLIVVNCIIMGRAEAYAGKNKPGAAMFDGIGMGIGFTIALILIAAVRELIGNGTFAGIRVLPASYEPISIFVLAPGAFFVLALFVAIMNRFNLGAARRTDDWDPTSKFVCGDCGSCPRILNCGGKPAKASELAEPDGFDRSHLEVIAALTQKTPAATPVEEVYGAQASTMVEAVEEAQMNEQEKGGDK